MRFKSFYNVIIYSLLLILTACSDQEKETKLVDLFTFATNLDIIAVNFPTDTTEDVISTNAFFDYKIEGLKSNNTDTIIINNSDIIWSLSAGAVSTIDQNGRFSGGSVAENITITAQVGYLIQTQEVRVSAAKFDRVVNLNSTPVLVNMCQAQQIRPIGSYRNDDGTTEERQVDSNIINTIEWTILNQEDNSPSQRAFIETENNRANLQAYETGDVIIQAKAESVYSSEDITSVFDQTLDNNLKKLKLCLKGEETDLATCSLENGDASQGKVVSLIAVAEYVNPADSTSFYRNISAYSKWGRDSGSIGIFGLSTDRQQFDITIGSNIGNISVSVACGKIKEAVTEQNIKDGIVLSVPVTCESDDCFDDTITMDIN